MGHKLGLSHSEENMVWRCSWREC